MFSVTHPNLVYLSIQKYLNTFALIGTFEVLSYVAEIKDYRTCSVLLGNRTGATRYQQKKLMRNHTFSSLWLLHPHNLDMLILLSNPLVCNKCS